MLLYVATTITIYLPTYLRGRGGGGSGGCSDCGGGGAFAASVASDGSDVWRWLSFGL